ANDLRRRYIAGFRAEPRALAGAVRPCPGMAAAAVRFLADLLDGDRRRPQSASALALQKKQRASYRGRQSAERGLSALVRSRAVQILTAAECRQVDKKTNIARIESRSFIYIYSRQYLIFDVAFPIRHRLPVLLGANPAFEAKGGLGSWHCTNV